jgi:hypothetical protein
MTKAAFRIAFVLLILTLCATTPSFAQYPSCQQCGMFGTGEEAAIFCLDADGWGSEECTIVYRNNFAYCRTSGAGCYQLEVRG